MVGRAAHAGWAQRGPALEGSGRPDRPPRRRALAVGGIAPRRGPLGRGGARHRYASWLQAAGRHAEVRDAPVELVENAC